MAANAASVGANRVVDYVRERRVRALAPALVERIAGRVLLLQGACHEPEGPLEGLQLLLAGWANREVVLHLLPAVATQTVEQVGRETVLEVSPGTRPCS